jgi:hypothetical protein
MVNIFFLKISIKIPCLIFRHYGVLLLYGQHLALNHLVATNQVRVVIGIYLLDQLTTDKSPQNLQEGIRLNFHCWHTNERFSKFAFKLGQYNQSELELYRNDTTAQAYVSEKENNKKKFFIYL